MFLKIISIAGLFVSMVLGPAMAQSSKELQAEVQKAWKSYAEKDYAAAAETFEDVTNRMRLLRIAKFVGHFPEAPSGWQAEGDVNLPTDPVFGGLISTELKRDYLSASGEQKIKMELSLDSINNFEDLSESFLKSGYVPVEYKGFKGAYKAAKEEGGKAQYSLVTKEGVSIEFKGQGVDEATAKAFLDGMDLEKIEQDAK